MAALTRYSNPELLKLPDCGGLLENGKCRWLNVPKCSGTKCSYCQRQNSLEKAQKRLRSLDEATQERIAQKYYGGFRPWADADSKGKGE
ncbi:hypothetical protein [Oscillibacter sp.]|uniref:hypothetical protein n=1 Tax=Oscillibacter sp. TaxID=1945593 RepID=UPI0033956048